MKCPNCGFVTFPGLDQCKKCGHRFVEAEGEQSRTPSLFTFEMRSPKRGEPVDVIFGESKGGGKAPPPESETQDGARSHRKAFRNPPKPDSPETAASAPTAPMDWQKELAERMQEYRRRRERIGKGKGGDDTTLDLDFGAPPADMGKPAGARNLIEFPSSNLSDPGERTPSAAAGRNVDDFLLEDPAGEPDDFVVGEPPPEKVRVERHAPSAPMEIEMEPSPSLGTGTSTATSSAVAPLLDRFLAGAFDFFVLLLSAGIFTTIYWEAGGKFSANPLDLLVIALLGVILLMSYFGLFTILANGTPGLVWTGIEVRTLEGNLPRRSDCLWRAFGYLVSTSALMLGFVWSLVDGDGLTWHDRMSRTLLVPSHDAESP